MKNWIILFFIGFTFVFTACTKKRDAQFAYGEGTDLYKIADYDNQYFDLKTTEKNGNLVFHTAAKTTTKINGKIQDFQYVKYETNSDLFPKEIAFIGKEKHSYKLVYQLTNTHLIISKVGTGDEIPMEELTSAQKVDDRHFAVPLVAYRISGLYTVDHARNENREKTSTLREYKAESKAQATHFRIDKNSKQILTLKSKTNLFHKNYFDGTWYASSVIAKVGDEESEMIGSTVSYDSKQESADKIIFTKSKDKIIGLNARYDDRIKLGDDLDKRNNLAEVIYFPAHWASYKRDTLNGDLNEIEDKNKRWEDRDYVEIDFTKITSLITSSLPGSPTLTDLTVTDDFFMFSLQFQGAKVTFSFLKEKNPKDVSKKYEPKRYFGDDFKYFGYFTTKKKSLNTYEKYRRDDFEKFTFINRFHPQFDEKTGKYRIVFHFTETSAVEPEIVETARAAIRSWDFAFKQAGLENTDIILDETEKVAVGDIRYNSINLIKTLTASSLFGFGPSIADPNTGEIISATTNVHVTSIKSNLVSQLRNYIRHRRGELDPNYPLGKSKLYQAPQMSVIQKATAKTVSKTHAKEETLSHHNCDFNASAGNLTREIESEDNPSCKKLRDYASGTSTDLKEETEALEACAQSILPQKVQATLIHEIGHNFGLRHNFAASADKENYTKKRDSKTGRELHEILARSSSVMEYTDFNEDRLTDVGPYDIEAIRFGYANKIKDDKENVHNLSTTKSIDDNLRQLGITKKYLKFCSDEHVELGMDPLCQRHDTGSSPSDVVESLIAQYNTLFATQNFRYDRAKSPSPKALREYKTAVIFSKLGTIYDQWRVYLTDFIGIDKQNLEVFDDQSYQNALDAMSKDPRFKQVYAEYKPAADRIFQFLLDITFMPSKYCLTQLAGGQYQITELERLTFEIHNRTGIKTISCQDKEVLNQLNSEGKKLMIEVGFYHQHQKRAGEVNTYLQDFMHSRGSDFDTLDSYWDVIGSADDKDAAKSALTSRSSTNFFAIQKQIKPSFMDEPQYRKAFTDRLIERIVHGISLESLTPGSKLENSDNIYFPKWHDELDHIRQTWAYMNLGIKQQGKDLMNTQRSQRWASVQTMDNQIIEDAKEKMKLENGSHIVAMTEQNDITIKLIQRLKWLEKIRIENSDEYRKNQIDYDAQYGLITHILNI